MNKAVITIPENIEGLDCTMNGVHPIIMVNALQMLLKHFCKQLALEAREAVGDSAKAQEKYLDQLSSRILGRDRPGGSDIILKNLN